MQDVRAATDEIDRAKSSAEKSNKVLVNNLNDQSKKVEEATLMIGDFESSKRKTAAENADLLRALQELENNANMLSKYKIQLVAQLDEAKRIADFEAKERQCLLGKFKNMEHELDGTKSHFDEESGDLHNVLRQVCKRNEEADMWKKKYELEAVAKAEDLEMVKLKLQARLSEAETTTEQLNGKFGIIERATGKLQSDISEVTAQLDQAHILNSSMEKKARQFDKVVAEWKQKADSLAVHLNVAQKDARIASSELFRVKSAYEESVLQLDEVRKENKGLSNEIKDIMDQISE
jgi:chromosome segregation ATPase